MKKEDIEQVLESHGLDRILEDNLTTLVDILDILVDLGYLNLDMYGSDDACPQFYSGVIDMAIDYTEVIKEDFIDNIVSSELTCCLNTMEK